MSFPVPTLMGDRMGLVFVVHMVCGGTQIALRHKAVHLCVHTLVIIANDLQINSINSDINTCPFVCSLFGASSSREWCSLSLSLYLHMISRQFVEVEPLTYWHCAMLLCPVYDERELCTLIGSDSWQCPTLTLTFFLTWKGCVEHSDLSSLCVCVCVKKGRESMGMVVNVCPVSR